jgi:hypothetical protein
MADLAGFSIDHQPSSEKVGGLAGVLKSESWWLGRG